MYYGTVLELTAVLNFSSLGHTAVDRLTVSESMSSMLRYSKLMQELMAVMHELEVVL